MAGEGPIVPNGEAQQPESVENTAEEDSLDGGWTPEPWLHAFYHTTTSVLGVVAVAALPISFAYLGWAGGLILLIASTAVSYYSGMLIIELQEPHQRTYSDIANSNMGDGFANVYIRPFQLLLFFQVGVLDALVAGQAFADLDESSRLSQSWWIVISGAIVFLLALAPTLSQMWQLSMIGSISAVAGSIVLVIASGISIGNGSREEINFDRPPVVGEGGATLDFAMGVLNSFGIIAFAYGGHSVLPDVQASLHKHDMAKSHRSMIKGLTAAYSLIFPCYLSICTIAYAAFGSTVSSWLVESIQPDVSRAVLILINVFVLVNNFALGAVYLQAVFTLLEDIFPCIGHHYDGRLTMRQVLMRLVFISLCTFVAVAIPFFGSISAFTGAVCFTPLTFIYPFIFWNRSKLATGASPWKIRLHWFMAGSFTILGLGGAIGALYFIVSSSSSYKFFQ